MSETFSGVYRVAFGEKHNNLFRPGPSAPMNACVGTNGGPANFSRYASGYFEAGAILVRNLAGSSRDIDILIYPLVFLYRHAIEASLKHLGSRIK